MCVCVVVADSSRARFLFAKTGRCPLVDDKRYIHPESSHQKQHIVSDGTGIDTGGMSKHFIQHDMRHEKSAHQQQVKNFAKQLCDEVDKLRQNSNLLTIYMIAPPRFLSLLRTSLSEKCTELLGDAVNKDLINHSIEEIRKHLPKRL